jgi:hypothetical protein
MKYVAYTIAGFLAIIGGISCRVTPMRTALAQITAWLADSTKEHFSLSEIQDLPPWTALYLFAPYTSESTIRQKLGFEWPDAGAFKLEERDDIHLAVFVTTTNLARVEVWSRGRFDCSTDMTGIPLDPGTSVRIARASKVPTLDLAEPLRRANRRQP